MPDDTFTGRAQEALIEFLRADARIAFEFLRTAAIDLEDDPDHAESAVEKARVALRTIRHLAVRIKDPAGHAEINMRADELEASIQALG